MLLKRAPLKFWLNAGATALLVVSSLLPTGRRRAPKGSARLTAPSASRKVPTSRTRSSCAEPGNVAAVGKPSILCRSPGEAGTTSSGVPIARCSRIASCRFLAAFRFLSCWQSFPAITALVSAYGLFFSPSIITNNLSLLNDVVPDNVLSIVHEQTSRIAANSGSALSITIVFSILVSLWSAMSGVKAMIDALNVIYEQKETRSFMLYRYGPDRCAARWQWVTVGSVSAAVTWIVASFLFSWYLSNFANYNATYGSLGAAVGVMVWLWISTTVMLLGAELNAEIEHQTARDSTVGSEQPLGSRGAVMADTVGAKQIS